MDSPAVRCILVGVALVLAAVDVIRTRGQSLTSWAAVAISVALLLAWWPDA